MKGRITISLGCLLAAVAIGLAGASAAEMGDTAARRPLTRPDDKAPDATKPVKVFILMGQSNTVGMGDINPETSKGTLAYLTRTETKYSFLLDGEGNWTVRKDYKAADAKFVLATIAFGGWKLAGPGKTIAEAQLAVGDPKKHPEFAGNVKAVEARGFWCEADVSPNKRQGYHYNRNAETYMEVGLGLGWAMADLLGKK